MKAGRVLILEWIFGDEKGWKFGEFSFADRMKSLSEVELIVINGYEFDIEKFQVQVRNWFCCLSFHSSLEYIFSYSFIENH
jgi:hypothetical protein